MKWVLPRFATFRWHLCHSNISPQFDAGLHPKWWPIWLEGLFLYGYYVHHWNMLYCSPPQPFVHWLPKWNACADSSNSYHLQEGKSTTNHLSVHLSFIKKSGYSPCDYQAKLVRRSPQVRLWTSCPWTRRSFRMLATCWTTSGPPPSEWSSTCTSCGRSLVHPAWQDLPSWLLSSQEDPASWPPKWGSIRWTILIWKFVCFDLFLSMPVLFQKEQMLLKDQRMKMMSQILNGIKVRKALDSLVFADPSTFLLTPGVEAVRMGAFLPKESCRHQISWVGHFEEVVHLRCCHLHHVLFLHLHCEYSLQSCPLYWRPTCTFDSSGNSENLETISSAWIQHLVF